MPKNKYFLIPLTQGLFAKIDLADFERVNHFLWFADRHKNGRIYAATNIKTVNGRRILRMHRLLAGEIGFDVDHENHDGVDNRRSNLRRCVRGQNLANSRKRKNKSSDFIGVSWDKSRGKWRSYACKKGKTFNIGRYASEKEAALAHNKKAKGLHGSFANLNKLKEKCNVSENQRRD